MNSANEGRWGDPWPTTYTGTTSDGIHHPTVVKLKPCPFCGCEMSIAIMDYSIVKIQYYSIVHPDNGCILEDYESRETSARQELVDKWNRRVEE